MTQFCATGLIEQTVEWLQKAAQQGDADAQFNLGVMYEQWRWSNAGL